MTSRPNRLILSGYGPLAGVIAVLLIITVTVPSKSPTGDEQFAASPSDQFSAAGPATATVPGAQTPVTAAVPGKAGKGAKNAGQVVTPAQVASAPQAQGVAAAANCAGGAMQVAGSAYSPACVQFGGNNGGATSRGVTADTITIAIRENDSQREDDSE
ncbi:MAG TPA: hypothetical protein VM347_07910, partial [Nonomuraea sp.]|nr:hypothetical protein [Nonomuraea sp.]